MKPGAGRQAESSDREVLAGLVERVTFHNPENGFCVLRTRARGHRDLVTVVGHAAMVAAGEWITASGEWVNDRTHGQQFKARFIRTAAPSSVEGIEKYLGSGMIRGIGPVYARKLVLAFGEKVFDVIEAEPERLREVTGIGKVRAKRITDAWAEQKVIREIMVFLHSHGVGTARAVRIFRTYGADAVEVMTENPYRLARDIRGIGLVTADTIAMKLGIAKTAMVRVRAGIGYALTEAMDVGHCGLPEEDLGPLAAKLLEVPGELIRAALDLELSEGTVVADTVGEIPCIFLGGLHRAERAIAGRLLGIAAGNLPWSDIDSGKALPWVEGKTGLALAPGQADAVRAALSSKISVTTGGPGVGKTTIVNSILRILSAKGVDILLCAATGRAVKRMSKATGLEAKTISPPVGSRSQEWWVQARRAQPAPLQPAGDRRDVDGGRDADAGAAGGGPRRSRPPDRGRCRPAALGGAGPGAGRHHRLRRGAGGAVDRGVPPGGAKPDRHHRPRHQPGRHPRPLPAGGRQRLLLRAGRGPRDGGRPDRGAGEDPHPAALRASTPCRTSRCCAR